MSPSKEAINVEGEAMWCEAGVSQEVLGTEAGVRTGLRTMAQVTHHTPMCSFSLSGRTTTLESLPAPPPSRPRYFVVLAARGASVQPAADRALRARTRRSRGE